jgi:hypothetical protein
MVYHLVLLTALLSSIIASARASDLYCVNDSTIVYNYENDASIIGTFINCLDAVQDGLVAPYYDLGGRINVSTEMFLNNLIAVDEVESTVTLDVFFSVYWVRPLKPTNSIPNIDV